MTEDRLTDTGRVVAFSDGVIAIAITLLVLEIHLPDTGGGNLLRQLGALWPSYLAYAGSFFTVGVIWLCHHRFFDRVRRMDGLLHAGNLLLLLTVAFLPFPTTVLAHHLEDGGWNARVATAFYGVMASVETVAWYVMWLALRRNPALCEPGCDNEYARRESRQALVGFVLFDLIALMGLLVPPAALVLYVIAVLAYGVGYERIRARLFTR